MINKILKITVSSLLIVTIINAQTIEEKNQKKETFINQLNNSMLEKNGLIKNMKNDLYINNNEFRRIIRKSSNNEDLKNAIYIYFTSEDKRQIEVNKKKKNIIIPKYRQVFIELEKATSEDNLLASYIGLKILRDQFLSNANNQMAKDYLRKMTKPLAKYGNPVALFWYGKSFLKEWSHNSVANYKKATLAYNKSIKEIDKILALNELNKEDKKRLERFRVIVELAKGKSSTMTDLKNKINKGESIRIKRKIDLTKYKSYNKNKGIK